MNWLNGHKTYAIAAGAILYAIGAYLTGNMDLAATMQYLFLGAGAAAIRHAIANQ